VLDIPAAEIEPAPAFGTRIRSDFIAGMGKLNGKFVILLNVTQVLALDALDSLSAATTDTTEATAA
jgi:purine-binding chemotaxis protein CheW